MLGKIWEKNGEKPLAQSFWYGIESPMPAIEVKNSIADIFWVLVYLFQNIDFGIISFIDKFASIKYLVLKFMGMVF